MVRNLVASLFMHGRVRTTPAKAKEARPFAEKLITLAKKGDLSARRRALSLLPDRKLVASLFKELGVRYQTRPGGYCRILRMARPRVGDAAPQAILELVEAELPQRKKKGVRPTAMPAPAAAPATEKGDAAPAAAKEPPPAAPADAGNEPAKA